MSNVEDRKQAMREQEYAEKAARTVQQIELQKTRRAGQGEYLGDMIGGFGTFAGGWGKYLVAASQLTIILCIGIMAIMVLLSAG